VAAAHFPAAPATAYSGHMYREIPPPPGLDGAIECFWTISVDCATARPNRVVPDGCADIILDLDPEAAGQRRPAPSVVGTMTRPLVFQVVGRVSLLGVRFRAGALAPLLRVNAAELTDAVLPLEAFWPDAACLREEIATATAAERIPRLAVMLRRRIRAVAGVRDATVAAADALLRQSHGAIPVGTLLRQLDVGARRLQRLYAQHVGTAPRFAARCFRLRHALRLLRTSDASAAQVAAAAGFFDQAHMIRDVRELAGTTPEQYRREHHVASIQSASAGPG
jgi:AraC-like DNA-binding protein